MPLLTVGWDRRGRRNVLISIDLYITIQGEMYLKKGYITFVPANRSKTLVSNKQFVFAMTCNNSVPRGQGPVMSFGDFNGRFCTVTSDLQTRASAEFEKAETPLTNPKPS